MSGEDLSSRCNAPNPGSFTGIRKTATGATRFLSVILSRETIKSWTEDHRDPACLIFAIVLEIAFITPDAIFSPNLKLFISRNPNQ